MMYLWPRGERYQAETVKIIPIFTHREISLWFGGPGKYVLFLME
jgi:hypothetical protein